MDRILFLCTGNSARSQMAEVIMNKHGHDRFIAVSGGSEPNDQVNPMALRTMKENGFDVSDLRPKIMTEFLGQDIEFVITLCDRMVENCPVFPSKPLFAHWGMPDPAAFEGTDEEKLAFFHKTFKEITNRINLLLCIDMTHKDRQAIEAEIGEIANTWKYVR